MAVEDAFATRLPAVNQRPLERPVFYVYLTFSLRRRNPNRAALCPDVTLSTSRLLLFPSHMYHTSHHPKIASNPLLHPLARSPSRAMDRDIARKCIIPT